MTYPVHLEMTHDMAEWLEGFLLAGAKGFDREEVKDLADAISIVSGGRYDSAGTHPHYYQVTSPPPAEKFPPFIVGPSGERW